MREGVHVKRSLVHHLGLGEASEAVDECERNSAGAGADTGQNPAGADGSPEPSKAFELSRALSRLQREKRHRDPRAQAA